MPLLSQDFDADLTAITVGLSRDYKGPPYAFSRWADGEWAVAFGKYHYAQSDGWQWKDGHRNLLSDCLLDSLAYCDPGWYVGITCEPHHPQIHADLLKYVNVPPEQLTFAEVFIFANYWRWAQIDIAGCLTVGPGGDFNVPDNGVETGWLWHDLAEEMIEEAGGPILVAAGPLSNAIIYEYWRRSAHRPACRQVILDVGSALRLTKRSRAAPGPYRVVGDRLVRVRGRRSSITREYQRMERPAAKWRPGWKLKPGEQPGIPGYELTDSEGEP
jgi:hypothetical protein